jgi:hypothetical protein
VKKTSFLMLVVLVPPQPLHNHRERRKTKRKEGSSIQAVADGGFQGEDSFNDRKKHGLLAKSVVLQQKSLVLQQKSKVLQ